MKRIVAGLVMGWTTGVMAAQGTNALAIVEPWSNLFSGRDAVIHVVVPPGDPASRSLQWQLSAKGGTVARGEVGLAGAAGGGGAVALRIPAEATRTDVIMPLRLHFTVADAGRAVAGGERTIWFFPDQPFAGRSEWLKKLSIQLFDPGGATRDLFQREGIPFREIRSADAVSAITDGWVIIGEGVSFREYRGLSGAMFKAASSGATVLCLAPAEGVIFLPVSAPRDSGSPSAIRLSRSDVVTRLDKRLDAGGWAPAGRSLASSLEIKADRGGVAAEIGTDPAHWAWLDVEYASTRGACVVCGLGIVGSWSDSPTPRYILARLIETMSSDRQRKQEDTSHEEE